MTLSEAIGFWNNPKTDFFCGYICWSGKRRGIIPLFRSEVGSESIKVNIKNGDFVLDEVSEEWVTSNNLTEEFIRLVQETKESFESEVNHLTNIINRHILERMMKGKDPKKKLSSLKKRK